MGGSHPYDQTDLSRMIAIKIAHFRDSWTYPMGDSYTSWRDISLDQRIFVKLLTEMGISAGESASYSAAGWGRNCSRGFRYLARAAAIAAWA
jgi:hypothetical protein